MKKTVTMLLAALLFLTSTGIGEVVDEAAPQAQPAVVLPEDAEDQPDAESPAALEEELSVEPADADGTQSQVSDDTPEVPDEAPDSAPAVPNEAPDSAPEVPDEEQTPAADPDPVILQSISLTADDLRPGLNENVQLHVTASPEGAAIDSVTWKSSSSKTATVKDGVLSTLREGKVTVTATVRSGSVTKTATLKLTVADRLKPTKAVLVSSDSRLALGSTAALSLELEPATAKPDSVTLRCSPAKIATIKDGVLTPHMEGVATVVATVVYGKTKLTSVKKITVFDPLKPTSATVTAAATRLAIGDTTALSVTLAPESAVADKVTYTTSSARIARVDGNGIVTAVAAGTVTVTATIIRGKVKKTAKLKLTVFDPKVPGEVKLTAASDTLSIGKTLPLTVSILPETAIYDSISYRSSSTRIATVTSDGVVTALRTGTVTITVTAVRGRVKKSGSIRLTVVKDE